jgi:hypothetical protein
MKKLADLRCSHCGVIWDMYQTGETYRLVPQIAPCESYQAATSQVCAPIFAAAYLVHVDTAG